MNNSTDLFCTKDEDTDEWHVWFPHPFGGMNILETFDNEIDARKFWQEQIDTADYDDYEE